MSCNSRGEWFLAPAIVYPISDLLKSETEEMCLTMLDYVSLDNEFIENLKGVITSIRLLLWYKPLKDVGQLVNVNLKEMLSIT